ncbi:MAG: hypothetical protein ACYC1E_07825 [Propionibacteriaceae bacterium]
MEPSIEVGPAEELVESRPGSGTYVPRQVVPAPRRAAPHGPRVTPRRVWSSLPAAVP